MAVATFVLLMVTALIFWGASVFHGARFAPCLLDVGENYEMERPAQAGTARTRRDKWSSFW